MLSTAKQIDQLNREHKLARLPFRANRGVSNPMLILADCLRAVSAPSEAAAARSR